MVIISFFVRSVPEVHLSCTNSWCGCRKNDELVPSWDPVVIAVAVDVSTAAAAVVAVAVAAVPLSPPRSDVDPVVTRTIVPLLLLLLLLLLRVLLPEALVLLVVATVAPLWNV